MTRHQVTVDGYTYEGHWYWRRRKGEWSHLIVTGPLEYKRPTSGTYGRYDGEWMDGPTGERIPGAVLMFAAAAASLAGIVAAIRHHRAWQARMRQYGALRAHR
jgi:hypothetical protein